MGSGEGPEGISTDLDSQGWGATRSWVEKGLSEAAHIEKVVRLRGDWTAEMRRLNLCGPGAALTRPAVLPSPSSFGTRGVGVEHSLSLVLGPCGHGTMRAGGRTIAGQPRVGGSAGRPVSTAYLAVAEVWRR